MRLLIDQGNTRTKWQLLNEANQIVASGSYMTQGALPPSAMPSHDQDVSTVLISSVASVDARSLLRDRVHELWGIVPSFIVGTDLEYLLKNSYESKDTLGVDRLVAAVGARQIQPRGNVLVIDAGTAVTIDLITDAGGFEGGVILPGFDLMREALVGNTAGIKINEAERLKVIGKTTSECVNSGSHFGVIGGIEKVVKQVFEQLGKPCTILVCGGDAKLIHEVVSLDIRLQADLIFLGLLSISNSLKKNNNK